MRKLTKISKQKLKKLYINKRLSSREIAKIYRCDKKVILNRLKEFNIKTRNSHIKFGFSRFNISGKELQDLYTNKKLNIREIAEIYKCSQWSVCKRLKECGIKVRNLKIYIPKRILNNLYLNKKYSAKKIAKLYKCSRPTIVKLLKYFNINLRNHSESVTIYKKEDFSNNLLEKAYLIGFRLGDLNVTKPSIKNGSLIFVKCGSTKKAQISLFKNLFYRYGHVHISSRIYKGHKIMDTYALLNNSFEFLLSKQDDIKKWILKNNKFFLAFLAGYIDAEGNIHITKRRRAETIITLESYDKIILYKIYRKLNNLRIFCTKPIGKIRERHNKPLYRLRLASHASVISLIDKVLPYLKHQKRIRDANNALKETITYMKFMKRKEPLNGIIESYGNIMISKGGKNV